MIRAVRCNQPEFKTVKFEPGFNVIVAERTKESTKKDSRNGLGKTTLIEIIHFCLGANATKGKGLRVKPLLGWTFYLDIELNGHLYTIQRNTGKPGQVIVEGDFSNWPIKPKVSPTLKKPFLSIKEWRIVLGWLVFGLPINHKEEKNRPTFRSLISYFIRKGRDAFTIPFEHHRKQMEWDKQINNAFLLGLGWEYAQRGQFLRGKDKAIKQLKSVANSGLMPNLVGSTGELEATKITLEEKVLENQTQLNNFQVHLQYREIEAQANTLTSKIHQLVNENISRRKIVEFYQKSLREERSASQDMVTLVYEEADLILPENVIKRLDEVQTFHQRITSNRQNFLESEIQRLEEGIVKAENNVRIFTDERAKLLAILQTHGALEEYTKLQQRYLQIVSQLEEVKGRIETLKEFEQEKSSLKIEQEQLAIEARADYDERKIVRQKAISFFNSNSESLYEVPGRLIINIDTTGFKFRVEIERSSSQGIEQMKVFCYDLMLAQLWSEKETTPGFLIHDSTIFDSVDKRQVAQALQLVAKEAELLNFQYICCLNSDLIPWEDFDSDFDINQYKRLELTDASEDGGLLGIRF